MQGSPRRELAAELERCARLCEDRAGRSVDRRDGPEVVSALLLAAAALDTAARALGTGDAATALLIATTLVRDAADVTGSDALREVAELCEQELEGT